MNLRKSGVFGGYGMVFVVIAVIMFATGRTFAGIITILIGFCGGFGFLAFREKFKALDGWMEGGAGKAPLSMDAFRGRFDALKGRKAEEAAKEELGRESRLQAIVARLVAAKDRMLGTITREKLETVGQKREVLDKERPEAEKSLEVLAIEKAAMMKIHSRSVQDLKAKRVQLKAILDEMKKRTPKLKKQADSLEKDIAAYSDMLRDEKAEPGNVERMRKKIDRLRKLEEALMSDKGAKVREAILSFSEAEKQDKYLTELLADVERIRVHLEDDFSEKHRGDDYAHLQRVIDDIRGSVDKLKPIPGEHRDAAARFLQRIHEFSDSVVGLKNSELATMRRDHTAAAEHAEALRIQSERRANQLDELLRKTEGERARWKSEAEQLSSQLQDVKQLVARWKSDLETAREVAKKNPALESAISDALSKNLHEQSGLLTVLIAAVNAKDEFAAAVKRELEETRSKADALEQQSRQLEAQNENNQRAVETAQEEVRSLIERVKELKERTAQAVKEAQETAEESVQKEKKTEIEMITEKLREAEAQLSEAQSEARRLKDDTITLKEKKESVDVRHEELEKRVALLETELRDAQAEADRWKGDAESLKRENEEQKSASEERIRTLEKSERDLQKEAGDKEMEIIRLSTDLTAVESKADFFFRKADEAWSKIGSFEDKALGFRQANEELQRLLEEERQKSARISEERDLKARNLMEQRLKVMQLEKLRRAEAETARNTVERLKEERKRTGLRQKELTQELKGLKSQLKDLMSLAADDATNKEIERLKGMIAAQEAALGALSESNRQNENLLRDAASRAEDSEKDVQRLLEEIDKIEERHKVVLAEMKEESERYRNEAEKNADEIDSLRGRISEHMRKGEGVKAELKKVKSQLDSKEEDMMRALADKDVATAARVDKERMELLDWEKELLDAGAETDEEMLKLTRKIYESTQRLFHVLESFRSVAEAESRGLGQAISEMTGQLELAERERQRLEASVVPGLRQRIEEIESQPRITPEVRAVMNSAEDDLRKAQEAVQIQMALTRDARGDLAKEKERSRQLEEELRRLSSRVAEEKTIEEIEKDRFRIERQAWFDSVVRPARNKLNEAKMSAAEYPDEALNLVNEGLVIARKSSEDFKNDFTTEEGQAIQALIGDLMGLERNIRQGRIDRDIASRKEVTQQTMVPKPVRIGVLAPFTVGEYQAEIKQYDSSGSQGKVVRWVALDYTKGSILLGRTQTHDASKRDLNKELCDVVITGAREDIVQISRKQLDIIRVDDVYILHYHGHFAVDVAEKNGNVRKMKPGAKLKLEDGMKFFLDPESSFGFAFSTLPTVNVERGQSPTWFRTVVDFSVRPRGPEMLGYLTLPSHAKCAEELKGQTARPSATRMIMLNKAVNIGKSMENEIAIDAQEDMERVVHEGGKLHVRKTSSMISQIHAQIKKEAEDYIIYNSSREWGIFVNYLPVDGKQKLNRGDVIHIGENEPVFFVFGMKEFQPSEIKIWDKYSVLFDNENFNCPATSYFIGTLSCNSPGAAVSVKDIRGNVKKLKDRRLLLNRHLIRFGKDSGNEVVLKLDPDLSDTQGKRLAELIGDEHFMVRREFGHIYLFKSLNRWGSIILVSGGKKMKAEIGNVCLFQSGDVIQMFDNAETFVTVKLEQVEWKEDDCWQQAEIRLKKPGLLNKIMG
ncbi:FHA domain-containing protein [Candidatus Woesearchaeota archaeon]|nr:FHA domain-containing protein [Candidatus Woesearchaeota archaeon]